MNEIFVSMQNELPIILNTLHFIRADWFYAFIPLLLFLILSFKTIQHEKNWQSIIDPQLMPFVLSKSSEKKRRRYPLLLTFIAASLCITALAGPVYKKLPQPVYREQSSLVILLDLSQSMNATDIKPSRLSRAKLELLDLLKTRKTGQTALIVYAADAFVVTPLTDDNATIANLVPSLETGMMPAQGSNLSSALAKTLSLFTQAGIIKGDILVITDGIKPRDEDAIRKIASQGHQLSIFGIGTPTGSPIPLVDSEQGGFLLDRNGAIVIPKLDINTLRQHALKGGGLYTSLQANDNDINKLASLFESSTLDTKKDNTQNENAADLNLNADLWQEEGHWLLLPLLFFAALWARRGWIAVLTFFILGVAQPLSQPLHAASIDTDYLWSSPDQKAMEAFNAGDNKQAAENFTQPEWKASALYRDGDYQGAAEALEETSSGDGFYNKGNALAQQGKFEEAIEAYNKALELDENNADATYNREQVKQAIEKQKEQSQNQDGENQDKQKQDKQEDAEQSKSDNSSPDNKDQQDEQQSGEQGEQDQDSEQQQSTDTEQSPTDEEKNAEEDELKQRDAEEEAKQQAQEKQDYEQNKKQQDSDNQQKEKQEQDEQSAEDNAIENTESEEKPAEVEINPVEASITEEQKATEQWLKRIPDDPGGLLRRKFLYQYKQIPNQNDDNEPW
ncbi:Aerotolerance protein BatB / Aerotolerance protein BatC [hydrothermal vent metagenome]|uniref:Aerotolerance protein BatB / Aerotolerance protein BatC n=1 Tax=hydrothermal vent metagenome TaxID=652676 RepID=A0A3B0X479_9ZZZZ